MVMHMAHNAAMKKVVLVRAALSQTLLPGEGVGKPGFPSLL